ncbi:MAG: thermonuclease family protein [Pseudomonadota bacterium]
MKIARHFRFLTFLALLTLTVPAMAQEEDGNYYDDTSSADEVVASPLRPESMVLIDSGTVTEVLKSDLILLNNKRYKLDNISTPVYEDQLAFDEMTSALLNRKVNVYSKTVDQTIDRYSIPLSHVVRDDGVWIQESLISKGLAWATVTGTNRQMMYALLQMEEKARVLRNGFWSNPLYVAKTPFNLKDCTDSYQVVEGKALYVSQKRGTIFFNFSRDWTTDFTIELPTRYLPRFTTSSGRFNPKVWFNHTIRVHGWVQEKNGPMIEVKYPEQVELVE